MGNLGKHSHLQPEAEHNAKLLLSLWMEEGITFDNDYETAKLPNEHLSLMGRGIKKSLRAGHLGFPHIAEASIKKAAALAEIAVVLASVRAEYQSPWLPYIFSVLNEFNVLKREQQKQWNLNKNT